VNKLKNIRTQLQFPCQMCGKSFAALVGLKCHMTVMHKSPNKVKLNSENDNTLTGDTVALNLHSTNIQPTTHSTEPSNDNEEANILEFKPKNKEKKKREKRKKSVSDLPKVCPYCQAEFSESRSFYSHIRVVHNSKGLKVQCSNCKLRFITDRACNTHIRASRICMEAYNKMFGMDMVLISVSKMAKHARFEPNACVANQSLASCNNEIETTDEIPTVELTFSCHLCAATYGSMKSLKSHYSKKHKRFKYDFEKN